MGRGFESHRGHSKNAVPQGAAFFVFVPDFCLHLPCLNAKYMKRVLYLCFVLSLFGSPAWAQNAKPQSLKVEVLQKMLEQTPPPLVIDVRTEWEYEAGRIGDALNLSPQQMDFLPIIKQTAALDQTIVVYCKMGSSSRETVKLLMSQGYQKVYNLKGGYLAWEKYLRKKQGK